MLRFARQGTRAAANASRKLLAERAGPPRRLKFIGYGLLAAVFMANTMVLLTAMQSPKTMPTLERWLPQSAELVDGNQLYDRYPDYLYPPFFLVLLKPLTWVPMWAAAVAWQVGKFTSLVVIFGLLWKMASNGARLRSRLGLGTSTICRPDAGKAGDPQRPLPAWVKIGSVVMSLRFIASDLGHGNVNLFICLFVVLGLWGLWSGRHFACGFFVALAAAIKVTPALWGVYLLYRRQWVALAGFAIGLGIALWVVPLAVLSPRQNLALLEDWYRHVVHGFAATGEIYSTHMNQSLAAVTNRLLGRGEWAPGETPVTLLALDDTALVWVQRGLALTLVGLAGWACRGRREAVSVWGCRGEVYGLSLMAQWSVVGVVTLALSGYTWTPHLCLLIPAHVVLLAYLDQTRGRNPDMATITLTAAAFLLTSMTGDLLDWMGIGKDAAAANGVMLWGALATGAALVIVLERIRSEVRAFPMEGLGDQPRSGDRISQKRPDRS